MLTYSEFIEKFGKYSDEELFIMKQNLSDYGEDAQKAFNHVIEAKGGTERLNNVIEQKKKVAAEITRIQKETEQLGKGGVDQEFIKKTATSEILTAEQVQSIVDDQYDHVAAEIEDKKIDQQTIGRSIVAGIIATLISGTALGALLIFTGAIHALIIIGILLLNYAIIKGITKRSKHNTAVFVTTLVACILSFVLGYLMFVMIGYRG